MWVYIKNSLLDCLLCIVASSALSYTACSGFYATQPYQDVWGTLLIVGICAVLTVALFAISLTRTSRLIGGIALAVVVLAAFGAAVATSSVLAPMEDAEGNNLYLAFCLLTPPIATFLLSRHKLACVLLIVVGVLFCGVIEYLYWYGHIVAFALFLVSSITLYVYRTYQSSLLNSESEHLAFGSVTAAGLALALVAVGAGIGLFVGAIAPLEPPNMVVKLITEHYRAEEKEVRGIGSTADERNDDLSNEQGDDISQSSETSDDDANADDDADKSPFDFLGLNDENSLLGRIGAGLASLTMNFPDWWPLVAALLVVLVIAAVIAMKKLLRRRRFGKMLELGSDGAARELYLFFLNRFARFKIPQPGTLTLKEYAAGFSDTFKKFEQRLDDPAFNTLTSLYVRSVYGGQAVTEEELSTFTDYYARFYKWACSYVGRFKYCRMFFRI